MRAILICGMVCPELEFATRDHTMDFLIAWIKVMYFPMLPYTLGVCAVMGLGVSLCNQSFQPLLYSLLVALVANVIVVIVYLKTVKFS